MRCRSFFCARIGKIDICNYIWVFVYITTKYLGVLISSDLKFSKQCIEVEKKTQKLLGYMKRELCYSNIEIVLKLNI